MEDSAGSVVLRYKTMAGSVFFFLVYVAPFAVLGVWDKFSEKKVPQWWSERELPGMIKAALIWLAISGLSAIAFYGLLALLSYRSDTRKIAKFRQCYSGLSYEEKQILNDVMVPFGCVPGSVNVGQLNALESIAASTPFVSNVNGPYELRLSTKQPLEILLRRDKTLRTKSKPKLLSIHQGDENPDIGIKVTVKPEGKRRQTFRNREFAGTREPRALEGFELEITPRIPGLGLKYMGHFEEFGDSGFVHDGEFITTPTARRLEGFAVELTGPANDKYDVHYMARIQSPLNNTDEFKNGEFCGTRGRSLRIEGISVWILPRRI
jgi:hypothetical protein